jgi:predicted aspartyl protease
MYTHEYDNDYPYGPAMPVVELRVRQIAANDDGIGLRVLIDSGADATILPAQFLQDAGVEQVGRARMRWGSHQSQTYDVYLATILIGNYVINGVRVLAAATGGEAILGRDVLNQMVVTLNGLAHVVEVSQ